MVLCRFVVVGFLFSAFCLLTVLSALPLFKMSTEPEVNFSESDNEDEPEEDQQVATREYANIHDAGFKDFVLKPDLLRAITDASFEHPSAVQHECIPRAIMGLDILCQAKAGMGKTAVFVIGTVQQLAGSAALAANKPLVLCIGHTHELAGQIYKEYNRFTKYYPDIRKAVFFGGAFSSTHLDCPRVCRRKAVCHGA